MWAAAAASTSSAGRGATSLVIVPSKGLPAAAGDMKEMGMQAMFDASRSRLL